MNQAVVTIQKRGAAVREALRRAARDVFMESGFDQASMDAVAERAGTTKRTLYAHCGSKAELFAEVIGTSCRAIVERLPRLDEIDPDPAVGLRAFLSRAVANFESDNCVPLKRIILAEAGRHPQFVALLAAAYGEVEDRLAAYVAAAVAAGRLKPHDARDAARALCNATILSGSFRGLLTLRSSSAADVEAVAARYLAQNGV